MAVRIKDGIIPYTGGIGIEITDNHVINVLLRAMNNLIMVNEDRELYVDLQLEDGIEPDADFPVGVTTGRILEEDGRQMSGIILNWKTTSGDYVRLIYGVDDNLYYDPGTGEWRLLVTGDMIENLSGNVKTFWLSSTDDLTTAQEALDWRLEGKYPIISYHGNTYLIDLEELGTTGRIRFIDTFTTVYHGLDNGTSYVGQNNMYIFYEDSEVTRIGMDVEVVSPVVIATNINYTTPYTPTYPGSPTTKKYVDDGLALKQDILTAGTNITIDNNNVISATIPSALVYKGNVQTVNDLPSSGQTVGDTYFVEGVDGMYSWDGTQWNYVGSTSPSLTNYFNMTINDSDDITEGSVHLFCTTTEKNYWNSKQDALTAGTNIQISNNVISATDTTYSAGTGIGITGTTINNTMPFDPENTGSLSQVLKRTSTGYRWANEANAVTSVNGQTGDVTVDEFDPENSGSTGQVLKKTSTGYSWQNESGGGGGGSYTAGDGISISNNVISNTKPFEPSSGGTAGQVLTKTANGYEWSSASAEQEVRVWTIPQGGLSQDDMQTITQWCLNSHHSVVLKFESGNAKDCFVYGWHQSLNSVSHFYFLGTWINRSQTTTANGDYTTMYHTAYHITFDGTTYTQEYLDYDIAGNYLTAAGLEQSNPTPFIPQYGWQPTSKAYVDSRNWIGTQAQYDALVSGGQIEQGVIYNILPS